MFLDFCLFVGRWALCIKLVPTVDPLADSLDGVFVRSAAFGQYVNGYYVAMLRRLAHLDHCSACDLITTHVLSLFI